MMPQTNSIASFCDLCDLRETCRKKEEYVLRDMCDESKTKGVSLKRITSAYWQIGTKTHPHPFQRKNPIPFLEAIEKEERFVIRSYDSFWTKNP